MVSLYILNLNLGLSKTLSNFLVFLKKIFKGQNMTTGPQWYAMKKNLPEGNSLQDFEQKVCPILN